MTTLDDRRAARLPLAFLMLGLGGLAACESGDEGALPPQAALDTAYGDGVEVALNGNVVDVRVTMEADQLRRGGSIWARGGPYIYLFTPQTQSLFTDYGGVGGVRVTTVDGGGDLVARALLQRATLNSASWRRAINVAGRARVDGTERPQTMIDLREFGEEHTEYEYARRYAGN